MVGATVMARMFHSVMLRTHHGLRRRAPHALPIATGPKSSVGGTMLPPLRLKCFRLYDGARAHPQRIIEL
jgi:hypothetical protein